jgi:pimeloyl-ACP methyl ester carboxylesterase
LPEIVLVHGLFHRSWSVLLLKRRLKAKGFSVRCFSYATVMRDPLASADKLAEFCQSGQSTELHLAGHSLGGLLILEMLRKTNGFSLPPGRVVLLGSPISGSGVARSLAESAAGRALLRESRSSLVAGVSAIPPDRECAMIAGTRPRGVGQVTGALAGPNDGTVAVSETRSDLLTDHIELAVTHTGMLFSAEVARQLATFVKNGRFDHPD